MGRKSKKQIELEKAKSYRVSYEARTNRKHYSLTLLPTRDKELIDWIECHKPINNYLRKLVEKDLLGDE